MHFQLYLDYALSYRDNLDILRYYLDYTIVPKAITLAAIALVCYLIGNTLYKPSQNKINLSSSSNNKRFSFLTLKIFIILFFVIFIYVTPTSYFLGGYGDILNSGEMGYLQYKSEQFLQISIWSYIICHLIVLTNNENRSNGFFNYIATYNPIFIIISLSYLALIVYAGDRGPFINITILVYVGYIISQRKKINIFKILFIVIIFGSLLQFLGYFRNTDTNLDFLTRINEVFYIKEEISSRGDGSILPVTVELATSLGSYHAAVMDQESNNILYGMGAVGYLISIIPGLGNLLQKITFIDFNSTAVYITEYLGTDYGAGTTALADTYLNFGFYGVLIIFSFFGYFFARLDSRAYKDFSNNSLFSQVLFMVFISSAVYLGRSSFFSALSNVLLVYLFVSFASFIHKSKY